MYERNPDVIVTALPGETVLLDPATRALFTLNASGTVVWERIEEGIDVLVDAITARFAVDVDQARADATKTVAELLAAGLVRATAP